MDSANTESSSLPELTPREHQVLELTALGLTNSEIARRGGITVHSVKFHLASVYRKLGVTNRTEAVVTYLSGLDRLTAHRSSPNQTR